MALLFALGLAACREAISTDAGPAVDAGAADSGPGDTGASAPPLLPPIGSPADLTVMTWNLQQYPLTDQTAARVVEIVEALEADLIGVQEIAYPDDFDALVAALPSYDGFDAWDDDDAYLRVGLLYRTSRVEVRGTKTIFREDSYAFPRPVLTATVTMTSTAGSFDFVFAVLHLKAKLDRQSMERRRRASERMDEWIRGRLATNAEQDYVIVGDLNDKVTDERDYNVFLPFLDAPDTYRFVTMDRAERGGYSYIPFASMIDHILVTTDALDEYVEGSAEILRLDDHLVRYVDEISDHRPVVARFRPRP